LLAFSASAQVAQESKDVPRVLDPLWTGIAQAGWCLGERQGL